MIGMRFESVRKVRSIEHWDYVESREILVSATFDAGIFPIDKVICLTEQILDALFNLLRIYQELLWLLSLFIIGIGNKKQSHFQITFTRDQFA